MHFSWLLLILGSLASLAKAETVPQIPWNAEPVADAAYPKHGIALQITERLQKTPLTLGIVDIPQHLGDKEILIRVHYAAQNPVDAKFIDYDRIPEFPWTNGGDVAGAVLAIGRNVTTLAVGERVASFLGRADPRHAGFQQYSIADAPQTFKIPAYLGYAEASSIPLAFATAVGGVFGDLEVSIPLTGSKLPLKNNGLSILVWGGSSSVGAYAIQLAKLSGFKVVATASPVNFDYVRSLGADLMVDYHDEDQAVEAIKEAAGGKLGLVVDAISENGSTALAVRAIGPNGGIISTVLPVGDEVKGGREDIKILSAGARIVYEKPTYLDAYRFIVEALDQRAFLPNRIMEIPGGLLGVNEGFRRQRAHEISGVKLVYNVLDTPGISREQ